VGNYDELDTARLEWVVLDGLVPPGDEPAARAALIARDRELRSLVTRGVLSEDEAIEILRRRQSRYGPGGRAARPFSPWARRAIILAGAAALVTALSHLAH
jgi:hypothetical protein